MASRLNRKWIGIEKEECCKSLVLNRVTKIGTNFIFWDN